MFEWNIKAKKKWVNYKNGPCSLAFLQKDE